MNIFDIEPQNRETEYRKLRDELAQNYSVHVGPTAQRNAQHKIAKQRGAGGHHAVMADAQEKRLENDLSEYDEGVHQKYLLAILTGRYDFCLDELTDTTKKWSNTFPRHNEEIRRAATIRLDERGGDNRSTPLKSFSFQGIEMIEATVKPHSTSAHVGLPKKWTGCRVAVVRLDEGSKSTEPR